MSTWEYKAVSTESKGVNYTERWEQVIDELNTLGAEGWEVVAQMTVDKSAGNSRSGLLLKREAKGLTRVKGRTGTVN